MKLKVIFKEKSRKKDIGTYSINNNNIVSNLSNKKYTGSISSDGDLVFKDFLTFKSRALRNCEYD